jgi:PAS domain S-box-containing protein
LLQLLRRLSPIEIASNQKLFYFLIQREQSESTKSNSDLFETIIKNSKDSIIFINKNETIDLVNSTVTLLLDYSSEYLLGQHFSTIFPNEIGKNIVNQITLMKQGQSNFLFEDSVEAVTESNSFIPVHAILLGIPKDGINEAKFFVLILRDEYVLQSQMKKCRQQKKKVKNFYITFYLEIL